MSFSMNYKEKEPNFVYDESNILDLLKLKGINGRSIAGMQLLHEYLYELCQETQHIFEDAQLVEPLGAKLLGQSSGVDVFSRPIQSVNSIPYYTCRNCSREIAASRFAPHLEKCTGIGGRNSTKQIIQSFSSLTEKSATKSRIGNLQHIYTNSINDEDQDDLDDLDNDNDDMNDATLDFGLKDENTLLEI